MLRTYKAVHRSQPMKSPSVFMSHASSEPAQRRNPGPRACSTSPGSQSGLNSVSYKLQLASFQAPPPPFTGVEAALCYVHCSRYEPAVHMSSDSSDRRDNTSGSRFLDRALQQAAPGLAGRVQNLTSSSQRAWERHVMGSFGRNCTQTCGRHGPRPGHVWPYPPQGSRPGCRRGSRRCRSGGRHHPPPPPWRHSRKHSSDRPASSDTTLSWWGSAGRSRSLRRARRSAPQRPW